MFTALYKSGSDVIDGYKATCLIVADKDIDAHLADGWVKTLAEVPVVAGNDSPTREDLESSAKELGLKFDGRTSDKKLIFMIEEAAK